MNKYQRYTISALVYQTIQWILYFILLCFMAHKFSSILLGILLLVSPILYYVVVKMPDKTVKDYLFQLFVNYIFNVIIAIIFISIVGGFSSSGEFGNLSGVLEIISAIINGFLFTITTILFGCLNAIKQRFSTTTFVVSIIVSVVFIGILLLASPWLMYLLIG